MIACRRRDLAHPRPGPWRTGPAALLLFILCLLGTPFASAAPLDVAVVLSEETGPYLEVAEQIESELAAGKAAAGRRVTRVRLHSLEGLRAGETDVIVAVGLQAALAVAATHLPVPVLNVLIPKAAVEQIARQVNGDRRREFSAVYLDQPPARQLALVQQALPGRNRVGLILGPDSADMLMPLQLEARKRGMHLTVARIGSQDELFPALQQVLAESDVLLSLPDPLVFNAHTIAGVLLTSYRYRVPVIGFSAAYVKAGALAAVHSTPAQLARQASEILTRMQAAKVRRLPPPQPPTYFSVSANYHVAQSLELTLDKEEALAARLRARELGP